MEDFDIWKSLEKVVGKHSIKQFDYLCTAVKIIDIMKRKFIDIYCFRHKETKKLVKIDKDGIFWEIRDGDGWVRSHKSVAVKEILMMIRKKCPQCFRPLTITVGNKLKCKECKIIVDINGKVKDRIEGAK